MAARERRAIQRALIAVVSATLALSACGWGPVAWLSSHTPESLRREARAVYQAATSSMPDDVGTAGAPELPPVAGAPVSYELAPAPAASIAEPGSGYDANFPLSGRVDDAGGLYLDPFYLTLCGPGAVTVALAYWPPAPNRAPSVTVNDPLLAAGATTWDNRDTDGVYRMRAYMLRLAYQARVPDWSQRGMLPQSYAQSRQLGGATLQVVRDILNWEASGENLRDWSDYFYHIQWNSAFYDQRRYPLNLYEALHTDIVTDLTRYHTPVIVEITAGYLPNWRDANPVNHFVAVTGYDDTAGTYTYLDTCKEFTGCNTGGSDAPGLHTADQLQFSAGVARIATNGASGDGGWVA
ncbi:MAG TPA: hypothetical protein VF808_18705 [Ktedonobacterales bacterium]